jgi:hypothetical protein
LHFPYSSGTPYRKEETKAKKYTYVDLVVVLVAGNEHILSYTGDEPGFFF